MRSAPINPLHPTAGRSAWPAVGELYRWREDMKQTTYWLLALAILFGGTSCAPREPSIRRVELVSYGLYTHGPVKFQRHANPHEPLIDGIYSEADVSHIQTTDSIPVRSNALFGVEYRVVGTPPDGSVEIEVVHVHPEMSLPCQKPFSTQNYSMRKKIGEVHHALYKLVLPSEMVYGPWQILIKAGDKVYLEKTFTLVKADQE